MLNKTVELDAGETSMPVNYATSLTSDAWVSSNYWQIEFCQNRKSKGLKIYDVWPPNYVLAFPNCSFTSYNSESEFGEWVYIGLEKF